MINILTKPSEKKTFELKSELYKRGSQTKIRGKHFRQKLKNTQKPEAELSLASSKEEDKKIHVNGV